MSFDTKSCCRLVSELAFIGGPFDAVKTERPKLQSSPNTWIGNKLAWLRQNEKTLRATVLKYVRPRLPSEDFTAVATQVNDGLLQEHQHAIALAEHAQLCHFEDPLRLGEYMMAPVVVVLKPSCLTGPYRHCFQGIPYPLTFGLRQHKLMRAADGQQYLQPGDVYLMKKLSPQLTQQWVRLVDEVARDYRLGHHNVFDLSPEEKFALARHDVEMDNTLVHSLDSLNIPAQETSLDSLEPTVRPFGRTVDDGDYDIDDGYHEGEVFDGDPADRRTGRVMGAPTRTSSRGGVRSEDAVPRSLVKLTEWLENNMSNITLVVPCYSNSLQGRSAVLTVRNE